MPQGMTSTITKNPGGIKMSVESADRFINYLFIFILGWLFCEYFGPFL